jgi:hypothetical protein
VVDGKNSPADPIPTLAPGELAWRTSNPQSVPITLLPPAQWALPVRTDVRTIGGQFQSTSTIELKKLPAHRPHLLSLIVPDPRDDEIHVSATPGIAPVEIETNGSDRRWDIYIPTAAAEPALSITTTSGPSARDSWRLPHVALRAGPRHQATLAQRIVFESAEVTLAASSNIERVGPSEWRTTGAEWLAEAARTSDVTRDARAKITAHITAARAGGRWVYRGQFHISPNRSGPLWIQSPHGTTLHAIEVDGVVLPVDAQLSDIAGRTVVLRWSSALPMWSPPQLVGPSGAIGLGESEWLIRVPSGLRIAETGSDAVELTGVENATPDDLDSLSHGSPRHFRVGEGKSLKVEFASTSQPAIRWPLVVALSLFVLVAILAVFRPRGTAPEQAALVGVLAAIALGPAAAAILLVPAGVIAWRIANSLRRAVRPRKHEPAWATS